MAVPINGATLQNISTEIYGDTAAGRNLASSFSAATGAFDPTYQGSKNSLANFRGYQNIMATGQCRYASVSNGNNGKIYKSTDYGVSWQEVGTHVWNDNPIACSGSGQYVLSGKNNGVFQYSNNYGATWTEVAGSYVHYYSVSTTGQYMIVGDAAAGRPRISTNYGATWTLVGNAISGGQDVAVSPDGRYMKIWGYNGYDRSTDWGATWTRVTASYRYPGDNPLQIKMKDNGYVTYTADDGAGTSAIFHGGNGDGYYYSDYMFNEGAHEICGIDTSKDFSKQYHLVYESGQTYVMGYDQDLNSIATAYPSGEGYGGIAISNDGVYVQIFTSTGWKRSSNGGASFTSIAEATLPKGSGYWGRVCINKGI